jgi:hypothetical protein
MRKFGEMPLVSKLAFVLLVIASIGVLLNFSVWPAMQAISFSMTAVVMYVMYEGKDTHPIIRWAGVLVVAWFWVSIVYLFYLGLTTNTMNWSHTFMFLVMSVVTAGLWLRIKA